MEKVCQRVKSRKMEKKKREVSEREGGGGTESANKD